MIQEDRFFSHIDKTNNCWLWLGAKNNNGYGLVGSGGKCFLAHRISWELRNGEIPENMCVLHKCDNPACVNPDHLWIGTQLENIADMDKKKRRVISRGASHCNSIKTHCPRGHEYNEENTCYRINKFGSKIRFCVTCGRQHAKSQRLQAKLQRLQNKEKKCI